MDMRENGHVKVLMSYNFNNVEVSRPLSPEATDDEYRREFDKAVQLCQEQVRKLQSLSETSKHFYKLMDEYLYVKGVAEDVEASEEPANELEEAAIARYKRLRQFCFEEHTSAWDWEGYLDGAVGDGSDMPF